VSATAKASRYKLTPPRAAASTASPAPKASPRASVNGKPAPARPAGRSRGGRSRTA
jgi:hypothetical protein